ncbi:MAG: hypothetical protein JST22_17065 [Bacteroidetes bacterium]|nr:hypothetical protein [Bacteroidota bacterium]
MRSQYDRSIERLVDGRMSPAEEARFLEQAASDPAAARMLAAERIINSAVQSDRTSIPVLSPQPAPSLLARLGNTATHAAASRAGVHDMKVILFGLAATVLAVVVTIASIGPLPETQHQPAPAAALLLLNQGGALGLGIAQAAGYHASESTASDGTHRAHTDRMATPGERHLDRKQPGIAVGHPLEPDRAEHEAVRAPRHGAPAVFREDSVHIRMDLRDRH